MKRTMEAEIALLALFAAQRGEILAAMGVAHAQNF